ncbi:GntR family transcriptional regulator [Citrifermentans bremense]|uniref:GntR family transcriptional regulator n=1 Tax=Citrifermentans bremense TaxID=60035 RepID=UPI0004052A3D|nr:GntR family transcriptional regulator [Citrifermentans bremense]
MRKTYQMVEKALVARLLKGDPKPGCTLESERDLAQSFSVSRATVREALQKLQNAGWISVQQRHCTVVNDFWSQGDLELISSITRNSEDFPPDLASHFLELRVQFAPDYARRAVENNAAGLAEILARADKVRNCAGSLVKYDWELHMAMAVMSGNRIYPLILNSFSSVYSKLRTALFTREEYRLQARKYYREMLQAASTGNAILAESITRGAMKLRLDSFQIQFGGMQGLPAPA